MREHPRNTVLDEPPHVEVRVRAVGDVSVEVDHGALRRELAWRSRRPFASNYRAFSNGVLAACIAPTPSIATLDQLPEHNRRRLMLAVVDLRRAKSLWRKLHGSALSVDERFFATMLWAQERDHRAVRKALRELRRGNCQPPTECKPEPPAAGSVTTALLGGRMSPTTMDTILGIQRDFERMSSLTRSPFLGARNIGVAAHIARVSSVAPNIGTVSSVASDIARVSSVASVVGRHNELLSEHAAALPTSRR